MFSFHIVPIIYTTLFDFRGEEQAGINTVHTNGFQIIFTSVLEGIQKPPVGYVLDPGAVGRDLMVDVH